MKSLFSEWMKLLFTSSRSQVICMMKAIAVSRFSRLIWFLQDWLYLICTRHDFSHLVEEHCRRKLRLVIYWDENGLLIAGFAQGLLTMIQLTGFLCVYHKTAYNSQLSHFTKFVCFSASGERQGLQHHVERLLHYQVEWSAATGDLPQAQPDSRRGIRE